jgi:hypothetical protein
MSNMGKKRWVFSDGDLPPPGDKEPFGHEALMITNLNKEAALVKLDLYFEDKDPVKGIDINVESERVKCFRLDKPLGKSGYRIPNGQYALSVTSTIPIVAVFGRLDVRQNNLAYYSVLGFSAD